jgi:hypothetical protein
MGLNDADNIKECFSQACGTPQEDVWSANATAYNLGEFLSPIDDRNIIFEQTNPIDTRSYDILSNNFVLEALQENGVQH